MNKVFLMIYRSITIKHRWWRMTKTNVFWHIWKKNFIDKISVSDLNSIPAIMRKGKLINSGSFFSMSLTSTCFLKYLNKNTYHNYYLKNYLICLVTSHWSAKVQDEILKNMYKCDSFDAVKIALLFWIFLIYNNNRY